jgi:hypothetical protein
MFGQAVGEYFQKQSMTLATLGSSKQSGYNLATIQQIFGKCIDNTNYL